MHGYVGSAVLWRLHEAQTQRIQIRQIASGKDPVLILPRKSGRGQAAMRSMSAGDL